MKNDGGPAFPSYSRLEFLRDTQVTPQDKEVIYQECVGLSLRDYFAAAWLSNPYALKAVDEDSKVPISTAIRAYEIADAMLAVRSKD